MSKNILDRRDFKAVFHGNCHNVGAAGIK